MMSVEAKVWFCVIKIINACVHAMGIAVLIFFIGFFVGYPSEKETGNFYIFIIIGFIISAIYNYFSIKKEINLVEKIYKEKDPDYFADI